MAINSLSSASYGLSGLASGMDTQSMVEAALTGINSKIEKNQQKSTQLGYKRELYQGITTKLTEFQKKYFDFTSSKTNLRSDSFFNTFKLNSESKAFSVTVGTSGDVITGTHTIDSITQIAKSASLTSNHKVSSLLTGVFDADALSSLKSNTGKVLKLTVEDGKTQEIDLSGLVDCKDANEAVSKINALLEAKNIGVKASLESSVLTFRTTGVNKDGDKNRLTLSGDAAALEAIGLSSQGYNKNGVITGRVNTSALLPSIDVSLDGIKKTIHYTGSTAEEVQASLQKELNKKFGESVAVKEDNGKFSFYVPSSWTNGVPSADADPSRSVTLTGSASQVAVFGVKSGDSSKINTNNRIGEANFDIPISGGRQSFEINGVKFSFDNSTTISDMINTINTSDAGVELSYSSLEDKFVMKSTATGSGSILDSSTIKQTEGNLLTAMFGIQGARGAASNVLDKSVSGVSTYTQGYGGGGSFTLNVDGRPVEFTIGIKTMGYTRDELLTEINRAISSSEDSEVKKAGIKFSTSTVSPDRFEIKVGNGHSVSIVSGGTALSNLGFGNGQGAGGAEADGSSTLRSVGITDTVKLTVGSHTIQAGPNQTIDSLTSQIEKLYKDYYAGTGWGTPAGDFSVKFDEKTGRISIKGVETLSSEPDLPTLKIEGDGGSLFGSSEVSFNGRAKDSNGNVVNPTFEAGQDAKFSYNGVQVTRSTNDFTLDGLTFNLKRPTTADEDGTITVERDVDTIFDNIKKFVDEYNEIVVYCNKLLTEEPKYKEYAPLTSDQEAAMSERQVELWEEKSKQGLLRNDSTITSILSELRSAFYQKSASSDLGLYNLGITTLTTLDAQYSGTLTFGTDGEATLRKKIMEDPDSVRLLFTASGDGIGDRINTILNNAVKVSAISSSSGSLVRMAGAAGVKDTSSTIYKELDDLNKDLKRLYKTYDRKYAREWKRYNALEKQIAALNSQGSYLTSMMGG